MRTSTKLSEEETEPNQKMAVWSNGTAEVLKLGMLILRTRTDVPLLAGLEGCLSPRLLQNGVASDRMANRNMIIKRLINVSLRNLLLSCKRDGRIFWMLYIFPHGSAMFLELLIVALLLPTLIDRTLPLFNQSRGERQSTENTLYVV